MNRLGFAGSMTAFLLMSAAPVAAAPGDDTAAEVMRDCGGSSLPRDQVSTCLERARVVDQSSPSPEIRSLEAKLEQRVRNDPGDSATPLPPPRDQMGQDDEGPGGQGYDDENGPPPPPDEDTGPGGPPDEDSGPDDQGPPDQDMGPDDRGSQSAAPDDDDEPPVDDGEDGYDNSQPDQGYDAPDAPDDEGPPPPDDDEETDQG